MGRPLEEDAAFSAYLASIQKYEPLDREEELRLARRWLRRKDREAADTLVRANLRFYEMLRRMPNPAEALAGATG